MGHDFLRHIDRCRLVVHVVDVSGCEGRDPVEDFITINNELQQYSPDLASRPMIVAANKTDILQTEDNLIRLREYTDALGMPLYEISAAIHRGTKELMRVIYNKLQELPPITVYEPEYVKPLPEAGDARELNIERQDGLWLVSAGWMERLIADVNF